MRGEIVVCKDFIGNELEMIVWDKDESFIFVHTKDQFSAHKGSTVTFGACRISCRRRI